MHRFVLKDFKLNREGLEGLEKPQGRPLASRAVEITRRVTELQSRPWWRGVDGLSQIKERKQLPASTAIAATRTRRHSTN